MTKQNLNSYLETENLVAVNHPEQIEITGGCGNQDTPRTTHNENCTVVYAASTSTSTTRSSTLMYKLAKILSAIRKAPR